MAARMPGKRTQTARGASDGRSRHRTPDGRRADPKAVKVALREAIVLAAEQLGDDHRGRGGLIGYLKKLAATEPTTFASLLRAALPPLVPAPPTRAALPGLADRVSGAGDELLKRLEGVAARMFSNGDDLGTIDIGEMSFMECAALGLVARRRKLKLIAQPEAQAAADVPPSEHRGAGKVIDELGRAYEPDTIAVSKTINGGRV
jgi:hypothetical protein